MPLDGFGIERVHKLQTACFRLVVYHGPTEPSPVTPLENRLDIIVVLRPEIMETFLLHVFEIITIRS